MIDSNYIIVTGLSGEKLSAIWRISDENTRDEIYRAIGETYRCIHTIQGERSGLFKSTENKYETRFPVHPSAFFLENEIKKGSGLKLRENGVLRRVLHDKITDLWSRNLDELVSNTPVLVHYSSFFWNICLESDPEWRVSRLTGCSDSLWWDAAVNLSLFRYPPFMCIERRHWESFRKGYKNPIDD